MPTLSAKQEQAALLLAAGELGKAAAEAVGVTPETISKWKRMPEFEALLNRIRIEALQSAVDKLRRASGDAAKSLIELSRANDVPSEVRRRACLDVLGYTNIQLVINRGVGPTDPEEIARKRATDGKLQARIDELMASLV